ncbi:DREB-like protein 1, partial [Trifolium pratense]
ETVIAVVAAKELNMFVVDVAEEEEEDMPDLWRNMVLMSPTHSLEYDYEDIDVGEFEDVSLWNF